MNEPRANPLRNFSSYTYNISLYIIDPGTFNEYAGSGSKIPSAWKLICQSGGISNSNARADGFNFDYYIDNLRITTATNFKMTSNANPSSFDFSFQITEPNGFKFPTDLVKAVRQVQKDFASTGLMRPDDVKETVIALQFNYLLVVRFYGYDKNGNVVTQYSQVDPSTTDTDAVFERSWPITISGFDFKLSDKMVVYNIKAVSTQESYGFGRIRGVIGKSGKIQGSTVQEMLAGSNPAKPNENVIGLVDILNKEQEDNVTKKAAEIPDKYIITFADPSIANGTIIGTVDVKNAPLTKVANPGDSTVKTSNANSKVETAYKSLGIANQPILNVIDQVITLSSYITDSLSNKEKQIAESVVVGDSMYVPNPSASVKPLNWYSIATNVKIGKFDNIRKTNSAEITYIIQKYTIPDIRVLNISKKTEYPGPFKRYQHYYMGGPDDHQKEILNFETNFNLTYFNLIGEGSNAGVINNDGQAPAGQGSSDASSQGVSVHTWMGKELGPIKSYLYGPASQIKSKMTILGDPDYLITAVGRGFKYITEQYGEDGFSLNPLGGQIFVEVDFKDVSDYDKNTGLLDPAADGDIFFYDYPDNLKTTIKGMALNVWKVESLFSRGLFTQELSFGLPNFSKGADSGSSSTATTPSDLTADANQSQAEVNRLLGRELTASSTTGSTTSGSSASQPSANIPVATANTSNSAAANSAPVTSTSGSVTNNNQGTTNQVVNNSPVTTGNNIQDDATLTAVDVMGNQTGYTTGRQ